MVSKQPEALRLADELESEGDSWFRERDEEAAAMLRKLYVHNTELENSLIKKSIAIQKIWEERDDLRQQKVADEALLRQALDRLEYAYDHMPLLVAHNIEATMEAIKERLNG